MLGALTAAPIAPDESTIRRVLADIDADALDAAIGAWLLGLRPPPPSPAEEPPTPRQPWRAVAVDGKTVRGSGPAGAQVHLLAVMDHHSHTVINQIDVAGKPNEINRFQPLLHDVDLTRTVVTSDAMHTQREHVGWLVTVKHAAYICVVKGNQPGLRRQVKTLPWHQVPTGDTTRDRGHGRDEIRRLQVITVTGRRFPHAARGTAPHPRHHLRRGSLPDPDRQRTPRHGRPAQPRDRHPEAPRGDEHRQSVTPQRPRPAPATHLLGIINPQPDASIGPKVPGTTAPALSEKGRCSPLLSRAAV
ncbi:MAG TPA: ISAs1 family transposase [Dactylosporangium sp.]|nr:ISAs1 family transposase [Dactylosporangium sp.]